MQLLKQWWSWLQGKRTYILTACGASVVALAWAGWIDIETANKILALLGFGAVAALRASK